MNVRETKPMLIDEEFEKSRNQAATILIWAAIAIVPVIFAIPYFTGASFVLGPGFSVVFALIGLMSLRAAPQAMRAAAAIALTGQCIAFTTVFTGHAWQIDSHFPFFTLLAVLITMSDVGAIFICFGLSAVHHISLTLFMPLLLFPTGNLQENLLRVGYHCVVLTAGVVAVVLAIRVRLRVSQKQMEQRAALQASKAKTEQALEDAKAAVLQAEISQQDAENAAKAAFKAQQRVERESRKSSDAALAVKRAEDRVAQEQAAREVALKLVVDSLRTALSGLAQGDLCARITTKFGDDLDGIRLDFNAAVDHLRESMNEVADIASKTRDDSQKIKTATDDMSKRSQLQAESVEKTSVALTELAKSVQDATALARNVHQTSGSAKQGADNGHSVVEQTIAAMGMIENSSEQISKITDLINDISFQTNLLALNAGVEAARAGDAGRGFAVVASEVRALAQRSTDAARDIKNLIDQSDSQVKVGADLVQRTGSSLKDIVSAVNTVSGLIETMTSASDAQSRKVTEISDSLRQIHQVSRRNLTQYGENITASDMLADRTAQLEHALSRFSFAPTSTSPRHRKTG